jgi:hypothetical protein
MLNLASSESRKEYDKKEYLYADENEEENDEKLQRKMGLTRKDRLYRPRQKCFHRKERPKTYNTVF